MKITGRERSIPLSFVLSLLTCGIYGFVWLYGIGKDIRLCLGRGEPNAGLNVFLTIMTCKVWDVYIAYKYPELVNEIQRQQRMPQTNLSLICVFLSVFSLWGVYGLGLINLALLQNELNKIFRAARDRSS